MRLKAPGSAMPIEIRMSQSRNPTHASKSGAGPAPGRAWLGIFFRCCSQYGRIYKNAAGTMYVGRCPRCGCEVSARVGEGGTDQRFFETT